MTTRSYRELVLRARKRGYIISLLFFWIESPEMARRRVSMRVSEGGHDIPTEVIYRRYFYGLYNLFRIFIPVVDYWALINNNLLPSVVADTDGIVDNVTYNKIKDLSCRKKK